MEQLRFIMTVGLPASGKSSFSKEMVKDRDDIIYLSSDEIRKEVYGNETVQDHPSYIFELMNKRTIEALRDGKHVIYDATNINKKKRKGLLGQLPKDVEKIVVYFATPYDEVIRRNSERERVVPVEVIDRMYKSLQIPLYSEGWDKIIFEYDDDTLEYDFPKAFTDAIRAEVLFNRDGYDVMSFLAQYFNEFFEVYDLPHDSKWHSFSVSRHIYHTYLHILENYDGEDKELMLWTALVHDIGKHFCKTFISRKGEPMKFAQFIGHEYVGSQMAVTFLKKMNFDDDFIHMVATLVQFHMYLLNEESNLNKLKGYVGEDMFEKVKILRDADVSAH